MELYLISGEFREGGVHWGGGVASYVLFEKQNVKEIEKVKTLCTDSSFSFLLCIITGISTETVFN